MSSNARIAHLTTVHPRRDVRIFQKQARSLAAAGYDVHLLVGDGMGDERVDGVQVHDIGDSRGGRLRRMLVQGWRMWRAARRTHARLFHFHDPELIGVGLLLRASGALVIYDSHEDLPRDILSKPWINPWLRRLVAAVAERMEGFAARRLSAVVSATPVIAQRFNRSASHSEVIANYPDAKELQPAPGAAVGGVRERAACYVGSITRLRGALAMLRAIAQLPGTRLYLAGTIDGAGLRADMESEPGWAQTVYLGLLDREGVRDLLARCSVGLVTLAPTQAFRDALPIKMFEYMAAGLPVVASDFPAWRSMLEADRAGVCVDPQNPAAIAKAVGTILDDPKDAAEMGSRGRAAVLERYRWTAEAERLVALYDRLLYRPPAR